MNRLDRGSRERVVQRDAASLLASVDDYAVVVRKTGEALLRLHQLVMTRICAEDEIELAEQLNDELKPALDYLVHFEGRRGS